ncbi:MAG: SDR family oxidoreductase [Deltaproteobacteria bacterium]|nr:SDR family oxidoreductase [Deltaproteobacteria bacterium]
MSRSLEGRVALVTGAGRRVGSAIARALAAKGMSLALHHHTSRDECERIAKMVLEGGQRALVVSGDLSRASECRRLVRETIDALGGIDVLVSSAASFERMDFDAVDEDAFDRAMALNVRASLSLVHEARETLRARGGNVVLITCTSASLPYANHLPYVVSKGAAKQLMRALAIELAPEVRVNAVAPGTVLAPESMDAAERSTLASRTLVQRLGTAEDVAEAVVYLAQADFVTGQEILVDGGVVLAGRHSGEG